LISLVLPYWDRSGAACRSLDLIRRLYPDIEVVVVDDGTPEPFPEGWWKLVRLPYKPGPLDPCVPLNRGVAAAVGDVIAISCIEVLHNRGPVLGAMLEELQRGGRDTYVQAACWAPDNDCWHAHSSIAGLTFEGRRMPAGGCFHFMSMLTRELWDRAGGFDEDYREGAGYDDPDFLLRLARAGAKFVMRDDLVVEHPRAGARSAWKPGMHERNRRLFRSKWCLP
jgi:hypothetical protein